MAYTLFFLSFNRRNWFHSDEALMWRANISRWKDILTIINSLGCIRVCALCSESVHTSNRKNWISKQQPFPLTVIREVTARHNIESIERKRWFEWMGKNSINFSSTNIKSQYEIVWRIQSKWREKILIFPFSHGIFSSLAVFRSLYAHRTHTPIHSAM